MQVLTSTLGDAQVLALTGRLDSDTAPEFEETYLRVPAGEARTLVLDLTALEYLSSAGLRAILSAGKALQAQEGELVLCVPKGPTRQIIEACGFHKLFAVCASLAEAGKHTAGNFRIHLHKEYEVDVITVYGRVDAERAPEMESRGRKILETPFRKLLINLSAVEYLSSAGLCALLNLSKLAEARKGGSRRRNHSPSPLAGEGTGEGRCRRGRHSSESRNDGNKGNRGESAAPAPHRRSCGPDGVRRTRLWHNTPTPRPQ